MSSLYLQKLPDIKICISIRSLSTQPFFFFVSAIISIMLIFLNQSSTFTHKFFLNFLGNMSTQGVRGWYTSCSYQSTLKLACAPMQRNIFVYSLQSLLTTAKEAPSPFPVCRDFPGFIQAIRGRGSLIFKKFFQMLEMQ
jgi:hypothetical protein